VIIDCPPTLSWLTINALTASDKVIVVVSPGYFELDSIVQISKTVKEVVPLVEFGEVIFRDFYSRFSHNSLKVVIHAQ
jgi:cellulose biosynthesis protein BcsQ